MKPEDPDSDWQKLLRRARDDTPPPINQAALFDAVRAAAMAKQAAVPGLFDEFVAIFGSRRTLLTCATLACLGMLFTKWEIANVNDSLPWVQLLTEATGGEP